MKAIVIGSGTIGSAVKKALEEKGHQVVTVGRKSGDYQADISDPESLKALFSRGAKKTIAARRVAHRKEARTSSGGQR